MGSAQSAPAAEVWAQPRRLSTWLTGKLQGAWARGSVRAEPGHFRDARAGCGIRSSGGGWKGDLEAEGLELAHVAEGHAVLVEALGVVVAAEVVEAGGGVGQQVPDDDQDGAGDRDEGFTPVTATPGTPNSSVVACFQARGPPPVEPRILSKGSGGHAPLHPRRAEDGCPIKLEEPV